MPTDNPKDRNENAKAKDWKVPMDMEGAKPEEYPERVGGNESKVVKNVKGKNT